MILGDTITDIIIRGLLAWYGFKSYKAIETQTSRDDNHWLTFWLLYGMIQFLEYWVDLILFWLPFYYELKIGLLVYLGMFGGATVVYNAIGKKAIGIVEENAKKVPEHPTVKQLASQARGLTESVTSKVQKSN